MERTSAWADVIYVSVHIPTYWDIKFEALNLQKKALQFRKGYPAFHYIGMMWQKLPFRGSRNDIYWTDQGAWMLCIVLENFYASSEPAVHQTSSPATVDSMSHGNWNCGGARHSDKPSCELENYQVGADDYFKTILVRRHKYKTDETNDDEPSMYGHSFNKE